MVGVLGHHAYDGSYSELHVVPFPVGTVNVSSAGALNFSVESATSRYFTASGGAAAAEGKYEDNVVVIGTNATTDAAASDSHTLTWVMRPMLCMVLNI